jgi:hypothetical protein
MGTGIMARVFNGKVEAEIREHCSPACNLRLALSQAAAVIACRP